MAKLAAIREASSLASSLGFRSFIIFTAVKGMEAMWMNTKKINWQLPTIFEDFKCIQQTANAYQNSPSSYHIRSHSFGNPSLTAIPRLSAH